MNFKTLLASLLTCLFVLTNLNASEINQSEIVESETVSVESSQVSEIGSELEVDSNEDTSSKVEVEVEVETRGSGYGPNDPIPSYYNGEKLITYYKDYKRYRAELFYTSGEKHADYTYNDKSWVTYTEYDKNGNKISYQSRYDNLKMKEKAEYHTNGKTKMMYNFYDTGRKSMYRTWNDQGIKTNQIQYYNQANNMKSVDYAYYADGKVSEYVKRYSNGKMKERKWYYSNGKVKRTDDFYDNGRKKMHRTWNSSGAKTNQIEYYNQANSMKSVDYAYYENGKTREFVKRYSNGKTKERRWYYSNGKTKRSDNYYSSGNKSMYRTWNSSGVKTDHREYYNQSNTQFKADYAYYDNGKVSEFIKWKSNGKRIEHVWIWKNGDSKNYKRIKRYDSKGKVYSDKSYNDRTVKSQTKDEKLAIEIENEINRVRKAKGVSTLKTDNKVLDSYCTKVINYYSDMREPNNANYAHPAHITAPARLNDNLIIHTNAFWSYDGNYPANSVVKEWTDSPGHANNQYDPYWEYLDVKVKTTSSGQYIEACYGETEMQS